MANTQKTGFTLIEVLVALAIAAVAVVGLMQLHLVSLSGVARADSLSQAVTIAQDKMSEMETAGPLQTGLRTGSVERNKRAFQWQTQVSDPAPTQRPYAEGRLRKVVVTVRPDGVWGGQEVVLSTLLTDGVPGVNAE